jgi:processive 1,2-diacylglycerol beta-glucosyltransferase
MIQLRDKQTGASLGTITKEQLQYLIDHLEEESADDQDYYLNPATLDTFEEEGIDPNLLKILRGALGDRSDMEIEWSED